MLICDINIFYRNGKAVLEKMLMPLGMDMYELITLLVIDTVPGITQTRLIPFLQPDKGNVTKILQLLEKKGLVYRDTDSEDQRIKVCFLTENGKAMVPQLRIVMNAWEERFFMGLDSSEVVLYHKISEVMVRNIMKDG